MKFARNAMARRMFVLPDAFAPNIATKVGKRSFVPGTGCTKRPERSGALAATVRSRVLPFPEREKVPYPELSKHLKLTFPEFSSK